MPSESEYNLKKTPINLKFYFALRFQCRREITSGTGRLTGRRGKITKGGKIFNWVTRIPKLGQNSLQSGCLILGGSSKLRGGFKQVA